MHSVRIRPYRMIGLILSSGLLATTFSTADPRPSGSADAIPPLVTLTPFPPPVAPAESVAHGTFTLVATNVPVDELLPALARKAGLNLDLQPGIQGVVNLNLTHRPLSEILIQIERQTGVQARLRDGRTLAASPGTVMATSIPTRQAVP
ncbi:MAG: hypothetical protein G8237_15255 [Magnetococcales bacterium]|nr:hypothetical protein [Magnetococcales bacterium]NGZ07697.1 hypothetical protein [Magnetococcales bacterium]